MTWLLIAVALAFLGDAFRLRGRITAFPSVEKISNGEDSAYQLITGANVTLSAKATDTAGAWAHSQGLEVLDLVPHNVPALDALGLAQVVDAEQYRNSPFQKGRTAGHAVLATAQVLERAELKDPQPSNPVSFIELVFKLKQYASHTTGIAIMPGFDAVPDDPNQRKATLIAAAGGIGGMVLVVQPLLLAFLAWGVYWSPLWGGIALALFHLQPLLALLGQRIKPPDLWVVTLFRWPFELWRWIQLILGQWQPEADVDPIESRRDEYTQLVKHGLEGFFEERSTTCPFCGGSQLDTTLTVRDMFQNKPGEFSLDTCADCGHIFQNPRLSIAGLNYYYRDFYDGLGEGPMDGIFGYSAQPYYDRAEMIKGRTEPKRWLDVGGGHGHFCCAARNIWEQTQFDCLDMSESVDEAVRRQWADSGYRGLFPELADDLAGQYDVLSMSHYLEHVRDPEEEIEAAAKVVCPNGYLMIEVPDPDSVMGRLLGRFWLPWFQPQHQNFLSVSNLEKLLNRHGFTAVQWDRGKAHQVVDFVFALAILFELIIPDPNRPWRPKPGAFTRWTHRLLWILGTPLVLLAWGLDHLCAPLFRRPGLSNTYRVLAKREAPHE